MYLVKRGEKNDKKNTGSPYLISVANRKAIILKAFLGLINLKIGFMSKICSKARIISNIGFI